MTLQELMVYCTTLSKKVESLEIDLKHTKQIYDAAYTRLIKKVKKLEKTGRKIAKINQDPGISLVQHDAKIQGRYGHDMEFDFDFDAAKEVSIAEKDISTAEPVSTAGAAVTTVGAIVTTASVAVSTVSPTRNTGVSTADDITMAETMVYIRNSAIKDKVVRLQAELEEEERQRIARVHELASSFNVEEWEDIQARVEADEELVQRKEKSTLKLNKQECLQSLSIRERGGYTLQQLRGYSFDEIKTLFETTMRKVKTFVPIESEVDRAVPELVAGISKRAAEEELDQESSKRQKTGESSELAEEPRDKEANELFTLKALGSTERSSELEIILRVHHVYTEEGIDIYIMVEKEYPLSRRTLTLMLVAKLLVDQDNKMSKELLRKIFMQAKTPRR
ncbi:hypothetical protein Tco_1271623 [Tanacetum coccineum]